MIRFENADVIMIGNFYRNYGYPFIDTNNGGTLKGALEALDAHLDTAQAQHPKRPDTSARVTPCALRRHLVSPNHE